MTDFRLVYVTTAGPTEARKIAKVLIEEKLIACANIIPNMESIYEWKGEVSHSQEAVLLLKTRALHFGKILETIKAMHDFECPCVLALPIERGHPEFLRWVENQTEPGC